MSLDLFNANVVITARQFNPSIVSQLWLVRHGLVSENDFREGFVFTEVIANVPTPAFDFLVLPDRVQFVPKVERERQQALIVEKLGAFVRLLPETPFTALGFNLGWKLIPEGVGIPELSRRLFHVGNGPIHRFFDTPDAQFGSYLSKDSLGFRLKLDVKPAYLDLPGQERQNVVLLAFNYHADINGEADRPTQIEQLLHHWDDAVNESYRIAHATED